MVHYRRNRITGGTFFFTVNLRDRRRAFLVEHINALRDIVRDVHRELPFTIDAMVVLPIIGMRYGLCRRATPVMRIEYGSSRPDSPDILCVTV